MFFDVLVLVLGISVLGLEPENLNERALGLAASKLGPVFLCHKLGGTGIDKKCHWYLLRSWQSNSLKIKILFPMSPSFSTKNLKHQQLVPSNNKDLKTIRATLTGNLQPNNLTEYLCLSAWNGRGHDWRLTRFLVPTWAISWTSALKRIKLGI